MLPDNFRTILQLSPQARVALEHRAETHCGQPDFSVPASAMIERYAFLVESGIRLLKERTNFTPAHFACACDALEGPLIVTTTLPHIGEVVAEAIMIDDLGRKWGLPDDAAQVFAKLDALEMLAIVDLAERYWRAVSNAKEDEPGNYLLPERFWKAKVGH